MQHLLDSITKRDVVWVITLLIGVVGAIFGINFPIPPTPEEIVAVQGVSGGITNLTGLDVAAPTVFATATPAVLINNEGLGNALEIQNAGTPVFYVDTDGNTTISGTCTGCSINSGSGLRITQPTAAATATPALHVNSLAAGAKLLEVADAATPVFSILNGGAVVQVGARTATGGDTVNNWVIVSAPTAVATATPAMVVDSLALGNILEVRDAATPVFTVNDGGAIVVAAGVDVDGTADLDEVDIDGVTNIAVGTEHIGTKTIWSTAITYTAAAGGSGTVATIGASEVWIVHDVYANITTDFDCTGDDTTLVIGDGDDPNGFCDLADAELQTADTEGTGYSAGWQCQVAATIGVYGEENSDFIYDGTETIDWLLDEGSGETITAGAATIYVVYTRVQ